MSGADRRAPRQSSGDPALRAQGRARAARALMAVLVAAIVAGAIWVPWHSTSVCDNRTYLEMAEGVAHHGLPLVDNGPAAIWPELRARWNMVGTDGRLWGALPPVFPYVAAPVVRWGGIRAVVRLNVLLLAGIALCAFAIARRLTADPLAGAAAAWITVAGAPLWPFGFDTSPYTLAILCGVASVWLALRALDDDAAAAAAATAAAAARPRPWNALACGFLGALAIGSHLSVAPITLATIVALFALKARRAALWALAGAVLPLAAVGAINLLRFHWWNPLSYGPCVWAECTSSAGLSRQSVSNELAFVAPLQIWAALLAAACFALRRRRWAVGAAIAVGAVALVAIPALRERAWAMAQVACGYSFDVSAMSLEHGFHKPPDGLGNFLGSYAVKAPLQCTPLLVLAPWARAAETRARRALWLVGAAALALFASLLVRGNLPLAFALGFPLTPHLRYITPALPLLAALAVTAARRLPWTWPKLALAAAVALGFGAVLAWTPGDSAYWRRVVLLRVVLVGVLALVALLIAKRARAAAWVAALLAGWGFAVTLGVDLVSVALLRTSDDRYLDAVARATPARFALVGWDGGLDVALSLRADRDRDIESADLLESKTGQVPLELLVRWHVADRPVFVLLGGHASPFSGLRIVPVDPEIGLYRVH
jgi:hypothetical protein